MIKGLFSIALKISTLKCDDNLPKINSMVSFLPLRSVLADFYFFLRFFGNIAVIVNGFLYCDAAHSGEFCNVFNYYFFIKLLIYIKIMKTLYFQ